MLRMVPAVLAAALLIAAPLRADDKPKEKKDRSTLATELQTEFRTMFPDVLREWRAAETAADKKKALDRFKPLIERAQKLVDENPKDDVAFDALMLQMRASPSPDPKIYDALAEHQLNNKKLVDALPQFARNPSAGPQKLIRAAMEKSTNKEIKGSATFIVAQKLKEEADETKDAKKIAALTKQAEELLEKVSTEFADVRVDGEPLKKQANKWLFEIRNLGIGMNAPEVLSKDLDDKEAKLSALKGKVVVLDIWATWCGPCRAMIPHEREMVEKLKDKPFALISISADDKKDTLKEFLEKEKMPWTHWWEGRREGGIINDWNVRFFPTIYVIDAKGVIRHKNLRGEALEKAVEKLLEETAKK